MSHECTRYLYPFNGQMRTGTGPALVNIKQRAGPALVNIKQRPTIIIIISRSQAGTRRKGNLKQDGETISPITLVMRG